MERRGEAGWKREPGGSEVEASGAASTPDLLLSEHMTMPTVQNAVTKKPMTSYISITSAYVTVRPPPTACL